MRFKKPHHRNDTLLIFDQPLITAILEKFGRDDRSTKTAMVPLSFEELRAKLNAAEWGVIEQVLRINPRLFGIRAKFITYDRAPNNLVPIDGQTFERDGETITFDTRHVPGQVWEAFQKLQAAMQQDINIRIMIESGYRSPAHQAITFLTYLDRTHGNITQVARGVAFPGYSQHGDPVHTAVDVIDQFGVPGDIEPQRFAKTKAFAWMTEHAHEYGFYMTYPQDNADGIKFEPWHWRYMPERVQK